MKKIGIITRTLLLTFILSTALTFAQGTPPATGGSTTPAGTKAPVVTNTPTSFALKVKITNPLKVSTIQDAVRLFVNTIVKLAIPVIVIFFLWSGMSFILAQGNPEKLKKARTMFFNTIIGALLILGAWTITNAIVGTVNSITGTSTSTTTTTTPPSNQCMLPNGSMTGVLTAKGCVDPKNPNTPCMLPDGTMNGILTTTGCVPK